MANTLNIQTESVSFKILTNPEPQFRLIDSGSEGSVMLVEPDPTLTPLAELSLRDSGIKFDPYIPDIVSSWLPYWSGPEWPEAVFFSEQPLYVGGQNVKNLAGHIWVRYHKGREPVPGNLGYHNLFADFPGQAGTVGDLSGLVVQSDTDLVAALDDLAGKIDEVHNSVLAEPLLHPIAVEFGQGKLDEPRPGPEFVALVNQLLTTVEIGAKSYDMSVDDDGDVSFIIVPVDGTLISGEFTTSGNLYAWHYDTDWTTQIDEIEINQDISWLLGLLG